MNSVGAAEKSHDRDHDCWFIVDDNFDVFITIVLAKGQDNDEHGQCEVG